MVSLARPPHDEEDDAPDESPEEIAVLDAIIGSNWAWSSVAELAAEGHDPMTIERLVALGTLVRWDLPKEPRRDKRPPWAPPAGPCVTLDVIAAERLGVVIIEGLIYGTMTAPPSEAKEWAAVENPRWARPWQVPRAIRSPRHGRVISLDVPDAPEPVDPAPGPEEMLLLAEAWDHDRNAPVIDGRTGKPVMEPVRLFAGPDGESPGVTVKLDRRKHRRASKKKRGRPRRSLETVTSTTVPPPAPKG